MLRRPLIFASVAALTLLFCGTLLAEPGIKFSDADYGASYRTPVDIQKAVDQAIAGSVNLHKQYVAEGSLEGLNKVVDPAKALIAKHPKQLDQVYLALMMKFATTKDGGERMIALSMFTKLGLPRQQVVEVLSPHIARDYNGRFAFYLCAFFLSPEHSNPKDEDPVDVSGGALEWVFEKHLQLRQVHCPTVTSMFWRDGTIAPKRLLERLHDQEFLTPREREVYEKNRNYISLWTAQTEVVIRKQKAGIINVKKFDGEAGEAFHQLSQSELWPARLYAAEILRRCTFLEYPGVSRQLTADANPCVRHSMALAAEARKKAASQQQANGN